MNKTWNVADRTYISGERLVNRVTASSASLHHVEPSQRLFSFYMRIGKCGCDWMSLHKTGFFIALCERVQSETNLDKDSKSQEVTNAGC